MAVISSIKQQRKKDRVNVYLDGKFGFGIDLDNFVILNLRVGQELSDSDVNKIVKKAEFQKTLEKILRFATLRLRSVKEINDWLYRKKVPETIQKDLFTKVKQFDLIDDMKFAEWWVETRQAFRPKARRILEAELKIKGIDKEIINEVLSKIQIDEGKIALDHLRKRDIHWRVLPKEKIKQKMLEYLVRKGFSFEIAKKAVNRYNTREDDKI